MGEMKFTIFLSTILINIFLYGQIDTLKLSYVNKAKEEIYRSILFSEELQSDE